MKIYYKIFVFLLFSIGITFSQTVTKTGTTAGQFLKIGVGARALAMGSAFSSVSGDAASLYWNPAGLSRLKKNEIILDHQDWVLDVDLDFVGASFRTPF
jgi:hypothetical protein